MNQQQHFSQIDIQTELRWRICNIAQELVERTEGHQCSQQTQEECVTTSG